MLVKDILLSYRARCAKCTEVITGKCISAMDYKWHLDHFSCENCGRSLVGASFVRKDDKPYCKLCPTDKEMSKIKKMDEISDLCEQCRAPITQQVLLFRGNKYHAHHFNCIACQKTLDASAREFDGELYCRADYEKIQSKVCFACRKPILGTFISALGKVFHPDHFICFKCETPFHGSNYFEYQGNAYCETHYKQVTGSTCQYCRKVVKGNSK